MNNRDNHQKKDDSHLNIDTNGKNTEVKALDDERRVKNLSPGMLVIKRFMRNRLAVVGVIIIAAMFLFSFVGAWISPYGETEVFSTTEKMEKEFAGVKTNDEYQYMNAPGEELPSIAKTKLILAITKGEPTFEAKDITYDLLKEGHDFYRVGTKTEAGTFTVKDGKAEGADASVADALSQAVADGVSSFEVGETAYYFELDGNNGTLYTVEPITVATKQIFATAAEETKLDYEFKFNAERAMNGTVDSFMAGGKTYTIERAEGDDGSVSAVFYDEAGAEYATASRFTMNAIGEGVFLTGEFRAAAEEAIEANETQFEFTEEDGTQATYYVKRDDNQWIIKKTTETHVSDTFANPSKEHILGTDGNGMDMLTRLMYGGRISLMVGFVVVFAEVLIGVVLGGIAGYFGGWLDNLIMRLVDIFNCIPALPLFIIIGSIFDFIQLDPMIRVFALMLILSLVQWPSFARLVRGQILSLREQEFMIATEATGISVFRRIFVHLIPNVLPQVIVMATMSLGSTILFEATLSFLGIGVKYPLASWGYIINAVNDVYVLTNYWFAWIPAGILIILTVLGFNFIGDGLRDAFDPKMKR